MQMDVSESEMPCIRGDESHDVQCALTTATEQACPCMSAHHPGTACDRASCAAQFPGLAADTGAAKPESQHGGFVGREAEARAARWLVAMQKHHAYDLSRRDFFACE